VAGLALYVIALSVAVAVAVVWVFSRTLRTPGDLRPPSEVRAVLGAARRRIFLAVAVTIAVAAILLRASTSLPGLLGLPLALAPTLSGALGLLAYAALPPRSVAVAEDEPREADLAPRGPGDRATRAALVGPAVLTLLTVALLVATGTTAIPDETGLGRRIGFETAHQGSASGPYPGWFYGVPLLVGTAVLALATVVALRRVSTTPAFPRQELLPFDRQWRRTSVRVLSALTCAALSLQLGGLSLIGGSALRNAADGFGSEFAVWVTVGSAGMIGGLLLLVGSVVCLTLAALRALGLTDAARRAGSHSSAGARA
jgi:hypothetical protein